MTELAALLDTHWDGPDGLVEDALRRMPPADHDRAMELLQLCGYLEQETHHGS